MESINAALTKGGKRRSWTEEDILEAFNDIRNGQSINATAKKYNIPSSTLDERAKKSNIKSTFINKIGQSTNNEYTEEDVLEALNDIRNGQSISASCKKFNIPLTTLREKAKKSNIKSSFTNNLETEEDDLERGRQKLLDKFYSSNKKTTSEPPKKKKSKVSVQDDEENLERCRQKLLDKLKSPSKLKKTKKLKRCDTKKLKVKIKKRHSMPN